MSLLKIAGVLIGGFVAYAFVTDPHHGLGWEFPWSEAERAWRARRIAEMEKRWREEDERRKAAGLQ